jgi:hypothetical protein
MISEIIAHLTGSRCGVLAYLMVVGAKLMNFAPLHRSNEIRRYSSAKFRCEMEYDR